MAEIKALGMEIFADALTLVAGEGEESDLLARGDIIVMPNCSEGSAARAREAGANIQTTVPSGPIKMWADYYFIYKGSENVDAAHAWINQAISAESMAMMTTKMGYAPPNAESYALLDPSLAEKLGWPGINDLLKNAPLSVLPDPDAQPPHVTVDDLYKAFDEVMASIGQ